MPAAVRGCRRASAMQSHWRARTTGINDRPRTPTLVVRDTGRLTIPAREFEQHGFGWHDDENADRRRRFR